MPKHRHQSHKNKKQHKRSHSRPPTSHSQPKQPHPIPERSATFAEGVLQHKGKFGFVLSENPTVGDVLIQGTSLRLAMNGDRVKARVTSFSSDNKRLGVIVEVLHRSRVNVVGTFKQIGNQTMVALENDEGFVRILDLKQLSPQQGDLVVVTITQWSNETNFPGGTLTEILGDRDTPGVDLQAVIRHFQLPYRFSEAAEREATTLGIDVPESAWKTPRRETFFHQRVFTIDGADAKDFDDAVSIEEIKEGWRLGVHIADVAEYVKEKSALDVEAYERGTSVYLSGQVLPMLPFPLSDNLCSLRPHCVRLTLSCIMDIDQQGRVFNYRIVEGAIESAKRFTYEEVERILKGENPAGLPKEIVADVRIMDKLAQLLRRKRFARGSLDFDFPEPHVITEENGRPKDIRKRERLESHKLIEDFMLLANETVARHMSQQPFLYRIHETPDPVRLEKLKKSLETIGVIFPQHTNLNQPRTLASILTSVEKSPLIQPMVHLLILRSLKQAVYSSTNKGHFGLASKCYTHFTSPIRRYPDLIVHRLLKERLHGNYRTTHWANELTKIAEHASKRERLAVDAEREFLDIQKTRLMEPHVGKIFTGIISSVTNFGFFVQLDDYFVDGLVHVSNLDDDFYFFDEARMMLIGRRTGKRFTMGQKVKIRLAATNILKHQLDFDLLSTEQRQGPKKNKYADLTSPSFMMKHKSDHQRFFKKKNKHRHSRKS